MEFEKGGELYDKVLTVDITFPAEICHFWFRQMLSTIQHIHSKGIAHLDLKPQNILLDCDYNIKIADFGLAKEL